MSEFDGSGSGEAAEGDFEPGFDASEEAPEAQAGEPEDEGEPAREPLPPDEIERRWRQTQGALRSSRADLKALKSELAQLRSGLGETSPATPPDPNVDPIGAVEWMRGQFVAAQEQQAHAQFVSSLASQEAEMAQSNPDYHDAIDFLRQSRRTELIDLGAPEEDVDQIVAQEFMAGISEATRNGLNPAKVAFKLARDRGFARRGRLGSIEAGSAAARTLSANGGRGGADGGSLEARIANLSGSALREAWRKHKAAMS